MGTTQIGPGYYGVTPDPKSVTDRDRAATKLVFDRVFRSRVPQADDRSAQGNSSSGSDNNSK